VWEPTIIGKWLEMLKETAPRTRRIAILGNPRTAAYYDYSGKLRAMASALISTVRKAPQPSAGK